MKLLSDQVSEQEVKIILRELEKTKLLDGAVVEFGCYVGTTSVYLAQKLKEWSDKKQLYLYDSFEGLPPKTDPDLSPAGEQFIEGELKTSKSVLIKNLKKAGVKMPKIKKAWFSELEPKDIPAKISFAYLDGDYYLSILDPLKLIWSKMEPGGIIVIDDYANESLPGAARAVDEWLKTHPIKKMSVENSLAIIRL